MFDWTNPTTFNPLDETNEFMKNYREALEQLREANFAALKNQRQLGHTSIMSNANTQGMMYSNFPEREKIQYDANVFMPAYVKAQQSYQTGLDDIRNNALNAINNVRYYQELAKKAAEDNDGTPTGGNNGSGTSYANVLAPAISAAQTLLNG